jgi:hypothetical protein
MRSSEPLPLRASRNNTYVISRESRGRRVGGLLSACSNKLESCMPLSRVATALSAIEQIRSGPGPLAAVPASRRAGPRWADIVAKRFCPSDRARLIQVEGRMRNIDSNTLPRRFDCCRFLFHRTFEATFATISARSGNHCIAAISGSPTIRSPRRYWNATSDQWRSTWNARMRSGCCIGGWRPSSIATASRIAQCRRRTTSSLWRPRPD